MAKYGGTVRCGDSDTGVGKKSWEKSFDGITGFSGWDNNPVHPVILSKLRGGRGIW
jgi:hypothetical protein